MAAKAKYAGLRGDMGVAPSSSLIGWERVSAASRPISSDKTLGGGKGHFSGRLGLPFPSTSLHEPVRRAEGN
jgi:hypothetical protein